MTASTWHYYYNTKTNDLEILGNSSDFHKIPNELEFITIEWCDESIKIPRLHFRLKEKFIKTDLERTVIKVLEEKYPEELL
jgi:hypothetical protein